MTTNEKRIVMAVFDALLHKPYSELNTSLGTETIKEMSHMYHRLEWEDHCTRYGKSYDDMTEDDWTILCEMVAAEEEARSYEE